MSAYTAPSGAELKRLFRDWGLARTEVATWLDVHPRSVAKWLGDERTMPWATLYALAVMTRLDEGWIEMQPGDWRRRLMPETRR